MDEHWNYFLALEADLEVCSRYVAFDENNYSTFSVEFAKILLAASAEVDVVAKILCKKIDLQRNYGNINSYRSIIGTKYTKLPDVQVDIHRYSLTLEPWKKWKVGKNPDWWESYNNVKHERSQYFAEANLENATLATAGLLVILLYCYYHDSGNNEVAVNAGTKLLTTRWYGWGTPATVSHLYSVPKEP